ncbi:hypothetical protein YC2023_033442 [Brassica napus]
MSDLEISDDFGVFWRYLAQAPEMTIELDHRSILRNKYRSMYTSEHQSTVKRAKACLVTANLKRKSPPIYIITPDDKARADLVSLVSIIQPVHKA